jgi:hypothetical protein
MSRLWVRRGRHRRVPGMGRDLRVSLLLGVAVLVVAAVTS